MLWSLNVWFGTVHQKCFQFSRLTIKQLYPAIRKPEIGRNVTSWTNLRTCCAAPRADSFNTWCGLHHASVELSPRPPFSIGQRSRPLQGLKTAFTLHQTDQTLWANGKKKQVWKWPQSPPQPNMTDIWQRYECKYNRYMIWGVLDYRGDWCLVWEVALHLMSHWNIMLYIREDSS